MLYIISLFKHFLSSVMHGYNLTQSYYTFFPHPLNMHYDRNNK